MENHSGFGIVCYGFENLGFKNCIKRGFKIHPYASIFTAELAAIEKALSDLVRISDRCWGHSVALYSDSRSALQSLSIRPVRLTLVNQILESLSILEESNISVSFCWVPAHVGIVGNEVADKLAKEATEPEETLMNYIPFLDFVPHLKKHLTKKWERKWHSADRPDKLYEVKPFVKPWQSASFKVRREETIMTRLRIGHTRVTHGYIMCGKVEPRKCGRCKEIFTVKHILINCPNFKKDRDLCFYHIPKPLTLQNILAEGPYYEPENIFAFLKATGFYSGI
jgi:kelch-like protein 2/3